MENPTQTAIMLSVDNPLSGKKLILFELSKRCWKPYREQYEFDKLLLDLYIILVTTQQINSVLSGLSWNMSIIWKISLYIHPLVEIIFRD